MDYCALSDIQTFTHLTYGTGTKPTSTEVSAIISDVSARIDLYLKAAGFVPPPTDTAILAHLKHLAIFGVAGLIGQTYNAGQMPYPQNSRVFDYLKKFEDGLKEIIDNPILLGIVGGTDPIEVSSNVVDGITTETEVENLFLNEDFKP